MEYLKRLVLCFCIHDRGEVITTIARKIGTNIPTTKEIIDKLADNGFVEILVAVRYKITEKGLQGLYPCRAKLRSINAESEK